MPKKVVKPLEIVYNTTRQGQHTSTPRSKHQELLQLAIERVTQELLRRPQ